MSTNDASRSRSGAVFGGLGVAVAVVVALATVLVVRRLRAGGNDC